MLVLASTFDPPYSNPLERASAGLTAVDNWSKAVNASCLATWEFILIADDQPALFIAMVRMIVTALTISAA
ncbi:MAG: hypothetical protein V3V15_03245 [Sphingorhabdus sp.]